MALIGFALRKASVIRDSDRSCFSWVVLKLALPALILYSFQDNISGNMGSRLLIAFLFFTAVIIISYGIGEFSARISHCPREKRGVWLFGSMFTNGGNLGMVILSALYTGDVLIYAAFYMFLANIFQATLGAAVMNRYRLDDGLREKKNFVKEILSNTPIMAGIVGCLLLVFRIRLPDFCMDTLSSLKNLTAPLVMLTVGSTMADAKLKTFIHNRYLHIHTAMRLIFLPLFSFAVFYYIGGVEKALVINLVLRTAMPCAANTVIFADQYNNDTVFASQLVFLSTMLSVLTIPVFVSLLTLIP